jgi:hypothetical protein
MALTYSAAVLCQCWLCFVQSGYAASSLHGCCCVQVVRVRHGPALMSVLCPDCHGCTAVSRSSWMCRAPAVMALLDLGRHGCVAAGCAVCLSSWLSCVPAVVTVLCFGCHGCAAPCYSTDSYAVVSAVMDVLRGQTMLQGQLGQVDQL